jgi:hypothetical protein
VSVSTTAEDDALLQERLGLFAKTLLVITVVTTAVGFIYMHFFTSRFFARESARRSSSVRSTRPSPSAAGS